MRSLCIVCEGATEALFVKNCLTPHLAESGMRVYPSILQAKSGNHKGGRVSVERLGKQIAFEYHRCDRISTLVDFYGFQDADGRTRQQLELDILAEAIKWVRGQLDSRFVVPYVQMYEFEGLLFTDIECFEYVLDGWSNEARAKLRSVREDFATPEDINNSRETSPSHRLDLIFNGQYSKIEHGSLIAEAIGLVDIRKACPNFNEWVAHLESWGNDS
jgi:hypothetical protein